MKTLMTLIGFISLVASTSAFAGSLGGKIVSDKKTQNSIYLECVTASESPCAHAMIITEVDGVKKTHDQLIVPMGNDFDQYAERWGMFNDISTEASIRMPPVPEVRYLYLVNMSMKAYRAAFKVVESSDKNTDSIAMKELYFSKLLEVIELN